jgi:hypothetical protein
MLRLGEQTDVVSSVLLGKPAARPRQPCRRFPSMKIVTKFDPAPIPIRGYDWCALDPDNYAIGQPIGWGSTEAEAIADLIALQGGRRIRPAGTHFKAREDR